MRKFDDLTLPELLPSSIAEDRNVKAAALAIDGELQLLKKAVPEALILSRIDALPEAVVDLLAWQFHVDFYRPDLPLEMKRTLVKDSIPWHRKKGTPWAVKKMLANLGFKATLTEWFEMDTRPHTFSVSGYYEDDPYNIYFLGPDTESLLIDAVFEAKPARSHLLFLVVAPPPLDLSDHECRWDVCNWEHGKPYAYNWGCGIVETAVLDAAETLHFRTVRCSHVGSYVREPSWDVSNWDDAVGRGMCDVVWRTVRCSRFLDRDASLAETPPRHRWHGRKGWKCGGTWKKSCEGPESVPVGLGRWTWED